MVRVLSHWTTKTAKQWLGHLTQARIWLGLGFDTVNRQTPPGWVFIYRNPSTSSSVEWDGQWLLYFWHSVPYLETWWWSYKLLRKIQPQSKILKQAIWNLTRRTHRPPILLLIWKLIFFRCRSWLVMGSNIILKTKTTSTNLSNRIQLISCSWDFLKAR